MSRRAAGKKVVRQLKRTVEKEESRRKERLENRLPNPFSTLVEKLCKVIPYYSDRRHQPEGDNVRFALISMPAISFDLWEGTSLRGKALPAGVLPSACERALTDFRGDAPQRMFMAFEEALRVALEDLHANVVCVSELGLPSKGVRPMSAAKSLAFEMSQKHGALIIAGTGHDQRTLCNTGYVFHPGCSKDGLSFHKAISAVSKRVGEKICVPSERRIPLIKMFGLKIASMICLDIADYASIASVIRVADGVDVILVPCYNKRFDSMREIGIVASKALPGLVALVNFDMIGAQPCHIARFGQLENVSQVRPLSMGAQVSIVDLKFSDFQKKRFELQNRQSGAAAEDDDLDYLFGRRPYWFYANGS